MKMMKPTLPTLAMVLAAFFLTAGCSTVSQSIGRNGAGHKFTLENAWSRTTLKNEFYGFRRLNRMSPIVLETMVIASNAIDGIVAFDRGSGRQLWRIDLENGVEGGAQVAGDKLY